MARKSFSIGNALTQGLEETVRTAMHYAGELRLDVVPISRLELDPDNPRDLVITLNDMQMGIQAEDPLKARKEREREALKTLAATIAEQGVLNPIIVYKHGEKYRLIAGERRTLASILAEKADIQARIIDEKPSSLKRSILQWVENVEREDLTLAERLINLRHIVAAFIQEKHIPASAVTAKDISALIGCSLPQATYYKAILEAPPSLSEAIARGDVANLDKAVAIAKAPEKFQEELIEACKSGANLKTIKMLAAKFQEKGKASNLKTAGRKASRVNLGHTQSLKVARLLIESVLTDARFGHLRDIAKGVNWADYNHTAQAFKTLIKQLEKFEK